MKKIGQYINENKIDVINIYLSYYDKDELISALENLINNIKNNDNIESIDFIHDDNRNLNFKINLDDNKHELIKVKNKL